MPEVEKVLVYWKGDDTPYEMSRREFMDNVQGTYTASIYSRGSFADYFKEKWESE